jgi:hypothetical protein
LKGLFNLSLPETLKVTIRKLLHKKVSAGIRSGVLVDLDGDEYWELLGMENKFAKLTTISNKEVSDFQKGYHTAYDLPFPVLSGYGTNNIDTAFRTNLFKSRGKAS